MSKKDNLIVKKRHSRIKNMIYSIVKFWIEKIWKIEIEHSDFNRQAVFLFNHQTNYDPIWIELLVKQPIYYICLEDLMSSGLVSKLLNFCFAPIPIKKQSQDLKAIRKCFEVVKQGGSIGIFPEGNRTYDGRLCYVNPAIVTLALKLKLPIVICNINGGYKFRPRWGGSIRKGKVSVKITRVVEPPEYGALDKEEQYRLICKELEVDENTELQYVSDRRAEYIERAMYYCPKCKMTSFVSNKNDASCKKCNLKIHFDEALELHSDSSEFKYKNVSEWMDAQNEYVNQIDVKEFEGRVLFEDVADYYRVIPLEKKVLLNKSVKVKLYIDHMELIDKKGNEIAKYDFDSISGLALVKSVQLNIYVGNDTFQLRGDVRFNALKYVNIYNRYKNYKSGKDSRFLGI